MSKAQQTYTLVRNLLEKKGVQYLLIACILLAVVLCIYTPETDLLKRGSDFTVHIMLSFLGIGLFFLVFSQKRLMFTALGASFLLCMFLKDASNPNLIFPDKNLEPEVRVAYINLSLVMDFDDFIATIDSIDADIISFAEVTPPWSELLNYSLSKTYKYSKSIVRIDPMGMAAYSKLPIKSADTIYHKNDPNLLTTFKLKEKDISMMSSYILPPILQSSSIKAKEHLNVLATEINTIQHPVFSVGGFNLSYWDNEIISFRTDTNLENSRRSSGLRAKEYDHIFFTNQLECTNFDNIVDEEDRYLGISGSFQYRKTINTPNRSYTSRILRF